MENDRHYQTLVQGQPAEAVAVLRLPESIQYEALGYRFSSRAGELQTSLPLPIESCRIYRDKHDASEFSVVVCAMFTPGEKYYRYADRLADSCEKYRLPYRIYEVPHVHTSISLHGTTDLAFTKANVISLALQTFPTKNILYVDVDLLFVDYPERIFEISSADYDLALYNWLNDWHNEAYAPAADNQGGKSSFRYYVYSHHIGFHCPDQLICSGGVQFYRNTPLIMRLLETWQHVIALSPLSADDECLDFAYNNWDRNVNGLKAAWLDKSYLRMPWWPHVKPVILHPGMPVAGNRSPLPAIGNRTRFYPEQCRKKQSTLCFPPDYVIDAQEKLLLKVENSRVVDIRPVQQEFWIYPEEM